MIGTIQDIVALPDFENGGTEYRVVIMAKECEFDKSVMVNVKPYKKKKSLSANGYFHALSDDFADRVGVSKAYAKNYLLGLYGQRERDENGEPIRLAVKENVPMTEREDIHTVLVGHDWIEGEPYDIYEVVRGTHTYNTAEMHYLIAGTIDECKDVGGIEVLPPQEVERLKASAERYTRELG